MQEEVHLGLKLSLGGDCFRIERDFGTLADPWGTVSLAKARGLALKACSHRRAVERARAERGGPLAEQIQTSSANLRRYLHISILNKLYKFP